MLLRYPEIRISILARCAAGDEAGFVEEGGAGVGDFDVRAVGDGFEEAQKGGFVRGQARRGRRGGADGGDVDGAAGEGGEHESRKVFAGR